MYYQTYFKVSLLHKYYQRGICPDFELEPTRTCLRLLKGHRLVLKPSINGLQLLIPFKSKQRPLLPLDKSMIFTFLLKLKNPDFASFTQFEPKKYHPSRHLYVFSNEENNKPSDLALEPTIIRFQKLVKIAMAQALSEPEPSTHLVLENSSPLEKRCAAIAELKTTQRGQIFGLVEIHHRGFLVQNSNQNKEFTIHFTPKKQHWSYYLVTDKATDANSFSIQDQGTDEPKEKLHFESLKVETEDLTKDRIFDSIKQRFPESQTVVLRSDAPVECREIGRQNLQLIKFGQTKKPGQTKLWIPHLPNPPNQHGIQVINLLDDL